MKRLVRAIVSAIILFVLSGLSASASDDLSKHFDPIAGWDGTYSAALPVEQPKPQLSGKCTTDDVSVIKDYLTSLGYSHLLVSQDVHKLNTTHEILYNLNDNTILAITFTKDDQDQVKMCVDYEAHNPFGDGPTFKSFILGQHIDAVSKEQDQEEIAKQKHLEEEHDPYQGDQNHS